MHLSDFQKRLGLSLALLLAYFALRLPHLRDLPVFCDESVYVHFGQMIHDDPRHNLFISMELGKFPLHYWLLALTYNLSPDPITAGRLLSLFCGALLIPALFLLTGELKRWSAARAPQYLPALNIFAPLVSFITITSPLLASYQRMALAEPLLLLESVLLLSLSLRLARQLAESTANPNPSDHTQNTQSRLPRRGTLLTAITLGLLWAATLLTKQNFSYILWLFPPLALSLYTTRDSLLATLRAFLKPFALATAIGLLCFLPVLFSSNTLPLSARLFYQSMLYQNPLSRSQIIAANFFSLLLPRTGGHLYLWPHNPDALLQDGMLYLYFTPLLFLLLPASLFLLRNRLTNRLPLFFLTWSALLLGPLLLSSNLLKARYALLGIFPLLLLSAWTASHLLVKLSASLQSKIKNAGGQKSILMSVPHFAPSFALALLLAWPLAATVAQTFSLNAPTRTQSERDEYLSDLSGGQAWQDAVAFLQTESQHHPLTLITGPGFSLNNDFLWLTFHNNPNVHLYCTTTLPLRPIDNAPPNTFLLSTDQWRPQLARPTQLPADPLYTVGFAIFDTTNGNVSLAQSPDSFLPTASPIHYFQNPPLLPTQHPSTGVVLLGTPIRLAPPTLTNALPPAP